MTRVMTPAALGWRGRQRVRVRRHWPWLLVMAVLTAGLIAMGFDHWRTGLIVIGASGLVGAALRGLLPPRRVALLVVRTRAFDVVTLVVMAIAIIVLALVIPRIRP